MIITGPFDEENAAWLLLGQSGGYNHFMETFMRGEIVRAEQSILNGSKETFDERTAKLNALKELKSTITRNVEAAFAAAANTTNQTP